MLLVRLDICDSMSIVSYKSLPTYQIFIVEMVSHKIGKIILPYYFLPVINYNFKIILYNFNTISVTQVQPVMGSCQI